MATPEIAAAMASIPSKKAELREALESLHSLSSSLASFTLKWQDLEDHFAALERSIEDRLRELDERSRSTYASAPLLAVKAEPHSGADSDALKTEATAVGNTPLRQTPNPNSKLQSLCLDMDGMGLRSYLVANRNKITERRPEIGAAIKLAPEPGKLVLDAICGFCRPRSKAENDDEFYVTRRACFSLLEELQELALEFSSSVRDAAKKVALDWKGKIKGGGDFVNEAWLLLELLLGYKLVSEFELDGVIELFVPVARRKQAPDLCKKLGLLEHMPDLVQKLKDKGRHLDAVRLIDALGLSNEYPLVPFLKGYLNHSKKAVRELRKNGNNSAKSQNAADLKELSALKAVVKAVDDHKLESKYDFFDSVKKRLTTLEQRNSQKKRPSSPPVADLEPQIQHRQQLNKRPRPLASTTVAFANHPFPPPLPHNHSQMGLAGQKLYLASFGSFGPSTGCPYDVPVPSVAGPNFGSSASHSPRPYHYSSESASGPVLYDRAATYRDYSLSGLPDRYEAPFYPRM